MTSATILQLAFGAVAGTAFAAFILFALETARSRGWVGAVASLAATILAMLLLLVAASQLQLALESGKLDLVLKSGQLDAKAQASATPDAKTQASAKPDAKAEASGAFDPATLLPAFVAFAMTTAFLGAALAGVAAGLLAWITRDDSSEADTAPAAPALEAPS